MKKCGILMVTLVMMFLMLLPQIALADEIVWEDNTKTGRETEGSEGSDFEGIDWGSETYEEKVEFTEGEANEETGKEEGSGFDSTAAALGAAAALAAATLLLGRKGERKPEKAGVYIAASDRERILSSINSLTKKTYIIDSEGYLREDETAPPRKEGSETYDSLLAGLINADKKTVIGTDSIYEAGGREEELEDGVAIGDNGTDQTVIVRSDAKDFGYTLAHELTHAYRGIYEHRKEDTDGGVNEDEEGNAILAENRIRYETGGELRRDGDSRADVDGDGIGDGDGSYGKVTSEEPTLDWLYERFTGGEAASGTVFSFAKKSSSKSRSSKGSRGSSSKSRSSKGSSSKSSSSKSSSSSKRTSSSSKKSTSSTSKSTSIFSSIKSAATKAVTAVKTKVQTATTKAKTTAQNVVNKVKDTAKKVTTEVKTKVQTAVTKAKTTAQNVVNKVKETAKKVTETAKKVTTAVKTIAQKAVTKVTTAVKTVVEKASNSAAKSASTVSAKRDSKPSVVTKGTSTSQTKTTGNPRKQVTPEVRKAAADAFDIHTILDTVGCVPVVGEPADLVNGLIYAVEKDYINAGISLLAVAPVVGDLGKAGKYGVKALKAFDKGRDIAKTFNVVRRPISKKGSKTFRIVANGIERVDDALGAGAKGSKAVGKGGINTIDMSKYSELSNTEVIEILKTRGLDECAINDLITSFDGPIYKRTGYEGEVFTITESKVGDASGVFVTRGSAGSTPAERINNLALPPNNSALIESKVELTRTQILLEGKVAPQREWALIANDGIPRTGGAWQVITDGGKYSDAIRR